MKQNLNYTNERYEAIHYSHTMYTTHPRNRPYMYHPPNGHRGSYFYNPYNPYSDYMYGVPHTKYPHVSYENQAWIRYPPPPYMIRPVHRPYPTSTPFPLIEPVPIVPKVKNVATKPPQIIQHMPPAHTSQLLQNSNFYTPQNYDLDAPLEYRKYEPMPKRRLFYKTLRSYLEGRKEGAFLTEEFFVIKGSVRIGASDNRYGSFLIRATKHFLNFVTVMLGEEKYCICWGTLTDCFETILFRKDSPLVNIPGVQGLTEKRIKELNYKKMSSKTNALYESVATRIRKILLMIYKLYEGKPLETWIHKADFSKLTVDLKKK